MHKLIERYFLQIVFILSGLALVYPPAFVWGKSSIPFLLGVIMFGMGLTLKLRDFVNIWHRRRSVIVGVLAQYTVMPLFALALSLCFSLSESFLIGMVLLGSCPGGTASNVMVYLARGNVALSVTMTLASTVLAPFLTPALVYIMVSKTVEVPFWNMVESIFWVIIFPLGSAIALTHVFHERIKPLVVLFPSISIVTIGFVIAVIIGLNQGNIVHFPLTILLAIILHNLLGLSTGYAIGKAFSCDIQDRRAIAIEVGMQNSGLAVSLATMFFTAPSALPGALFSLWHNISGITLAKYWSGKREASFPSRRRNS